MAFNFGVGQPVIHVLTRVLLVLIIVLGQITGCHHNFCRSCIQGYIDAAQGLTSQCPKCQKPLTVDFNGKSEVNGKESATQKIYKRKSILNRIDLRQFQTSTKIEAVVRL